MSTYKNIYLTQTGTVTLKGELRSLRRRLTGVSQELKEARWRDGEFENGDLEVAETEYEQVSARIDEISGILTRAKHLRPENGRNFISLGSQVKLKETDGTAGVYQIVDSIEANPAEYKISDQSPLGQALEGRRAGETVHVQTPNGNHTYSIVNIR